MFFNGAQCDIYIGTGAGKKLLREIRGAQSSIKIVSPYLSPSLVKELIGLHNRGIDVQLVTTDNIEDFYGDYERNLHRLIIQHRTTDRSAVDQRDQWERYLRWMTVSAYGLLGILVMIMIVFRDMELLLGTIPILCLFVLKRSYHKKIRGKRIYHYTYSKLFPFRVINKNRRVKDSLSVHGKIYLIDERIAYLGSLNFTTSGTKNNYETRIRTVDWSAVRKIDWEFGKLMQNMGLPEKEVQQWGREIYPEPIN